jgi:hypothetical protein
MQDAVLDKLKSILISEKPLWSLYVNLMILIAFAITIVTMELMFSIRDEEGVNIFESKPYGSVQSWRVSYYHYHHGARIQNSRRP